MAGGGKCPKCNRFFQYKRTSIKLAGRKCPGCGGQVARTALAQVLRKQIELVD